MCGAVWSKLPVSGSPGPLREREPTNLACWQKETIELQMITQQRLQQVPGEDTTPGHQGATLPPLDTAGLGTVAQACNPSTLGGQGRQITRGQEFETKFVNMVKPHLY
ncbi:uncharacterized protein LOC134759425 isoform X5 [Pongo abelii]|uniref:uncharacterized protein LOC134759425 isoform X5 n=1 Tax=Pongo abelii TaxID=9601 RepID=UPI0030069F90